MPEPSVTDMQLYCSNKSSLIRIICRTNQWSGLHESDVNDWLYNNFKDIQGKYLATKLLLHSLYYSEENLVALLTEGIYNQIIGEEVKEQLFNSGNIHLLNSVIGSQIKEKVNKTLFIPLLNSDKPNESGNSIIRYLTHKLHIPSSNIDFHFNVSHDKLDIFERVIIVDDCIGSGNQLNTFWNYNDKVQSLKALGIARGIRFYYLVLIGYEKSIIELQINDNLIGIKVVVCDKLDECNRVFSSSNNIWADENELQFCIKYFENVQKNFGVKRLGYNGLDFAVFVHNTTPDWSLPIFWTENSDWRALLKRKESIK